MRRILICVAAIALAATACQPPPPAPGGTQRPYLDEIYRVSVTPADAPLSYGSAPPIDPLVGPDDPYQRPLDQNGNEVLRLWVSQPTSGPSTDRPAIVWVHGGGFKTGVGAGASLARNTASSYASRGYVGFSIEYRIDTTSDCQWVQDNPPSSPDYDAMLAQCMEGMESAQQDAQAAVRWVRHHATEYGVDPSKVAVGGFSAGAIVADDLAYRANDSGSWVYNADDVSSGEVRTALSRVSAAFGASGCTYRPEDITSEGRPISMIHSEGDLAVDYSCIAASVDRARSLGLVAELTSYCDQRGHANALYMAHQTETDAQWTTFLARELGLYSGMRAPSADPTCTAAS
jgi:acetyl esterase/lipase